MEKYNEGLAPKSSFCCSEKDVKVYSFIEPKEGVIDNRVLSIVDCGKCPINFFKGTMSICFPKMNECIQEKDTYKKPVGIDEYEINVHGWLHNCLNEPTYGRFAFCAKNAEEAMRIYCLLVAMANNQLVFDDFEDAKANGLVAGQKWVVSGGEPSFGHEAGTQVVQIDC